MNEWIIRDEFDLEDLSDRFVCPDCGMPLIPGGCPFCKECS